GDKTVVQNNDNIFKVIVTQAQEKEMSYTFDLYVDDDPTPYHRESSPTKPDTWNIPLKFNTLGAHTLKVVLTPSSYDYDPINNEFYKAIYVIPKPKIRTIGLDVNSPLADILLNLYDVSRTGELDNIDNYKALVIDNTNANTFTEADVKVLENYLNEGNGIIVVGGENAYNFGGYLDSPIETILPVTSKPTDWSGGRNVVLLLDISPSTTAHQTLGDILGNALNILNNEKLRDAYVGVIAFGSQGKDVSGGLQFIGVASTLDSLQSEIEKLTPSATSETSLDQGLAIAQGWLKDEHGEMDIIIISDGGIEKSYDASLKIAKEIVSSDVNLYYIHIKSSAPSQMDSYGNYYAEDLMNAVGGVYFPINMGERANIQFNDLQQTQNQNDTGTLGTYPLIELNTKHFITKNIDIEGSVTGYNDVTPKAGADRLIITNTGKPILTTWRYGLGRVAALTTDNGLGANSMWATELYSGNNSKLISSTVNWAIGNPIEKTGAVVEAPDTWYGTPSTIQLTMYDEGIPTLKLDGKTVDLSLTGTNVYEAVIEPEPIGMHDLSGYPVAVNYALEYRNMGLNEDILNLVKANGGTIYKSVSAARSGIFEEAQTNSEKLVKDTVSQKIYFLLAALIIFLGEVTIRRIKEIKEMKQQEKEIRHEA
ncbi:MAG: hypothetical protein PWQ44_660, partial [Methanolobus sp.]|nr:hypothetical protein [Methanolobus sp.]